MFNYNKNTPHGCSDMHIDVGNCVGHELQTYTTRVHRLLKLLRDCWLAKLAGLAGLAELAGLDGLSLGRLGFPGWLAALAGPAGLAGLAGLGWANSRNNVRLIRWDVRSKNNTLGLQPQQPVAQPLKRIPYLSRCIGSSGNAWGPRSSPGEQRLVKGAAVSTEMKGDLANQPSPLRNESRTGLDPAALPWCLAIVVAC